MNESTRFGFRWTRYKKRRIQRVCDALFKLGHLSNTGTSGYIKRAVDNQLQADERMLDDDDNDTDINCAD